MQLRLRENQCWNPKPGPLPKQLKNPKIVPTTQGGARKKKEQKKEKENSCYRRSAEWTKMMHAESGKKSVYPSELCACTNIDAPQGSD